METDTSFSRHARLLTLWLDEPYRVSTTFDAVPHMFVERVAASLLGVLMYGVHVNGFVRKNGKLFMWVARRPHTISYFPGRLDQLVAGGHSANMSA